MAALLQFGFPDFGPHSYLSTFQRKSLVLWLHISRAALCTDTPKSFETDSLPSGDFNDSQTAQFTASIAKNSPPSLFTCEC